MKFSRAMLTGAVIVAAVFVTFGRTIRFDFVGGWDDGPLIYNNDRVNPPTANAFVRIWSGSHARMYIPVVYSTWWTLAKFASVPGEEGAALNPYVFHAANMIVHAASALIVFAILRLLVRRDWPAAAGALLFALHPLQVEPVAWATGLKDVLSGMLALAAMWQYLCFTTADDAKRGRMHYAIACALFVLALLAKPSSVVVPFVSVVIEWLILGRKPARWIWPIGIWIGLAVLFMVLTATVQPTPDVMTPPFLDRIVIAANAVGFYVIKLIWPARLGIDYGLKPEVLARSLLFIVALAAVGLILLARRRWLVAAGLVFVIGLAPTLGLKPFVFQWWSTVADRYAYLALLGAGMAVAILLVEFPRTWVAWAAAIAIAGLGARTVAQESVWADADALMTNALIVNPNSPVAHNALGDAAFRRGDFEMAEADFAAAVQSSPRFLLARDNLAATLVAEKRYGDAAMLMKETLGLRRELPAEIAQPIETDLEHLAAVLTKLGRADEAAPYRAELAAIRSEAPSRQR